MKHRQTRHADFTSNVTVPRPPVSEPSEREDPFNAASDTVEKLVRNPIASSRDVHHRMNLKRLPPQALRGD